MLCLEDRAQKGIPVIRHPVQLTLGDVIGMTDSFEHFRHISCQEDSLDNTASSPVQFHPKRYGKIADSHFDCTLCFPALCLVRELERLPERRVKKLIECLPFKDDHILRAGYLGSIIPCILYPGFELTDLYLFILKEIIDKRIPLFRFRKQILPAKRELGLCAETHLPALSHRFRKLVQILNFIILAGSCAKAGRKSALIEREIGYD